MNKRNIKLFFHLLTFTILKIVITFARANDNSVDDIIQMVDSSGFNGSSYDVETEDGYILKVHRVLSPDLKESERNFVFFLQHGLFTTAADFVMTGKRYALAFYLAKHGGDVWLGNTRGSKHSVRHKNLTQDSDAFWDFSFNEMGRYDLPAMINFVRNATNNSKLIYVGHSQGGAAFLSMMSFHPDFNEKIRQAHLITPAVFMKNFPHPFINMLFEEIDRGLFNDFSYLRMAPVWDFFKTTRNFLCQTNTTEPFQCSPLTFLMHFILGPNENAIELETEILRGYETHMSDRVAMMQLHHFRQLVKSGTFSQFDFGAANLRIYKSMKPPQYDLSKTRVPVYLFAAKEDWLVSPKDIKKLMSKLPNAMSYRVFTNWNHEDVLYGKNARRMLYSQILNITRTKHLDVI